MKCSCGSTLFLENNQASGWWKVLFDSEDPEETIETDTDGVRLKRPNTVKCVECGKKHPNPRRDL